MAIDMLNSDDEIARLKWWKRLFPQYKEIFTTEKEN